MRSITDNLIQNNYLQKNGEWIEHDGLSLYWHPKFIETTLADTYYEALQANIQWQQGYIHLFGKTQKEPRLSAYYGDAEAQYQYSGRSMIPLPWNNTLLSLKKRISIDKEYHFNSVLCNYYRAGQDSMGWHSDDEPELGASPAIASISFGETRRFLLRQKKHHKNKLSISLAHGDLLIMSGETQANWQHHIPKSTKKLSPRINLTFRHIKSRL